MARRAQLKQASLRRVLDAAAARLRREGLGGAAIAPVMKDAGLTHGAFYSHFSNKDELTVAAFQHALADRRQRWMGNIRDVAWVQRLARLGKRYLTTAHRDNPSEGCALAALVSDAGRSSKTFHTVYEQELRKSLAAICDVASVEDAINSKRVDDAIAFMALCVGGISLARAVNNQAFSERILRACNTTTACLATQEVL